PLQNLISNSLQLTINLSNLDSLAESIANIHQQIKNLQCMQIHNSPNILSLLSTIPGLVPIEIISVLTDLTLSKKTAISLAIKFQLHLNKQIYNSIWIPYCISRSQANLSANQSSSISTISYQT
ncbi:7972_t:CDS:1, partial [Ambispora leptoticha]